ncbi:MAG: Anaphase-promoting complex subunit 23 [Icmadophila ericetorum]|nr:Anaphase-promoting complex subunit 23 [Icmadophila ericetorum]
MREQKLDFSHAQRTHGLAWKRRENLPEDEMDRQTATKLRDQLLETVVKCSERCLYQSAKWAAELASSVPIDDDGSDTDPDSLMRDARPPTPMIPTVITGNSDPQEARMEAREIDKYLLAKSFFDCREYERCSVVFLPSGLPRPPITATSPQSNKQTPLGSRKGKAKDIGQTSAPTYEKLPKLSQKSLFLALYAKYMAGEKRKDEESGVILSPSDTGAVVNKELIGLTQTLETWFSSRKVEQHSDGWLEYLYGIVLAKGKNEEGAKRWLIRSVSLCPFNWGSWLELSGLIGSIEELQQILPELEKHIMPMIFLVYTKQKLWQVGDDVHNQLANLLRVFPESQFLRTQHALVYFHASDYIEADKIFSEILQREPHRLDSLEDYSNILFVMESRPKLAFLAQLAIATDKFRPETCCIVGNYYALKSEHEKAVIYFCRALTLDRSFLSAWTLMGHEYVELKNNHAAIESYRRAVDINRKDYRAWYGLGQAYEVLEMHQYALFYYQRSAHLKMYDPKMWQAVAMCFDKVNRPLQAIKAYKRALVAGSYYDPASSFGTTSGPEGGILMNADILYHLAILHEKIGDLDQAASYMDLCIAQEDGPVGEDDDDDDEYGEGGMMGGGGTGPTMITGKARLWLARWTAHSGDFERSLRLCNELCTDGCDVEEAKALIRELRGRMEAGE